MAAGLKPIRRGRSASEYIPRSRDKDNELLPEIPAIKMKSTTDRSASASGKDLSEASQQKSPTASTDQQSLPSAQQSPRSNQSPAVVSSGGQTSGTEEALEASTDFARNVRGTSTPIDVSPETSKNRSQTFENEHTSVDVSVNSDANLRKPTDTVDTIDTQQIELSVFDEYHGSHSQSAGGTVVIDNLPSP